MTTATKTKPARASSAQPKDATAMLRADHQAVSELFEQYEKARSSTKKVQLVAQLCQELKVHAQIEEEIFYPAFKQALKDKELIPEATVEHDTLKSLIGQIEGVEPDGEMYDAKVKVLSEYVKHHVKEEQGEIFPKARDSSLDLVALGARLAERKAELLAQ
ncbi:MAG: hemerythrin domain-containing protein [Aquabacterium sp.]|jgi:hemerythrin superfamily protein|nr:MAG: hemerythrin domain-containing protein [Aquabacterium sp.]